MEKLNVEPIEDRVVVLPDTAEDKTAGGIYVPDTAKQRPLSGTIVATGPGWYTPQGKLVPTVCKVGDKVLYPKSGHTEVPLGDQVYLFMRERDLFCILERAEKS